MSSKFLIVGLGLAVIVLIALTRCGTSEGPAVKTAPLAKASVAGSFSSSSQPSQSTDAPAPIAAPVDRPAAPSVDGPGVPMGVVPPGQTVPVGVPLPGGIAFGPGPQKGPPQEGEWRPGQLQPGVPNEPSATQAQSGNNAPARKQ